MASFTDKVKAQVDKVLHPGEHKDHTATGSTATGTAHTGHSQTGTGVGAGVGTGTGVGSTNAGPHSSNLANKADPRVDSDLDGSRNFGAAGTHGHSATAGTDYNNPQSTNLGPHSTNTANKLDPRVDSDGDRGTGLTGGLGATGHHTGTGGIAGTGHHTGTGIGSTGYTGTGIGSTGHTGTGIGSTGHTGTGIGGGPGPAPNTAGPHSSDLLNKADPRVDSDLDGSKTVGGNATY